MELRLERDGQPVTLRLKKNDNVMDDVPVYTSEDKVVRKVDTAAMPVSTIQTLLTIFTYFPTKSYPMLNIFAKHYSRLKCRKIIINQEVKKISR